MATQVGTSGKDTILGTGADDDLYGLAGDDSIDGGAGNDYLDGGDGNDTLVGGIGDDQLFGGAGNNRMDGGDGADYISAYTYAGNNTLIGGAGNDTLYSGTGFDSLDGGDGADSIGASWDANPVTISGGAGDDSIYGGSGNDSIDAGADNDYVDAGAGNDTLLGGTGNDTLFVGAGDNSVDGGAGADYISAYTFSGRNTLLGGAGNDTIYAGSGNDSIDGGDDNDIISAQGSGNSVTLLGGAGNDSLYGGNAGDSILGGAGNDYIDGGPGANTLDGGTGIDTIFGGTGNDLYLVNSRTTWIYDYGGTDSAVVSASFAKLPSTIESVTYTGGALALPYWLDALLPDGAAGLHYLALLGGGTTFNFAFPSSLPSYDASATDATGWSAFNAAQQTFTRQAFSYIHGIVNLSFVETATTNAANTIVLANNTQGAGAGGYAYNPSTDPTGSDLFLNGTVADNLAPADGSGSALVLIHELGHTLGLKHPGNYNVSGGGTEAPYLSAAEDDTQWTVMSYAQHVEQFHLQYSVLDIAALQYLYGPSPTARSGSDTYVVSTSSTNFIWDGAGTDALDASALSTAVTLYLEPGYWGFVGTKASTITSPGQVTVNFGTVIENLFGGSGNDSLTGNAVGNSITGGAGADTLAGMDGDDILTGGAGNDSIDGGAGFDIATYSGAMAGYTVTRSGSSLTVTGADGTDTLLNVEELSFSDGIQVLSNSLPTGTVTITGTPTQNQLLTASNTLADADGLGTITYQWKANGSNVATGTTYTLTQAEVGKTITVTASYTDGGGTAEAVTSSATAAVANVNDVPTGSVTITGTPTQGQLLTAANTLADADGLGTITYQWKANGSNIATGTTYTLTQAEVGKTITVTASYTDGGGTAESVTSSATAAVANVNDAPTGSVTISGTPTQGQLLTASNTLADADGLGTITYQWKANGSNVATGTTYTLTQAEVGKTITVTASYTDGGGTAEAVTSSATAAVANVNDVPTGSVTITGTPTQGQLLTAANTLADADGLGTITYQWKANGSNIATGTTYTLTQAEVGKTITVTASYTDGGGTAESVTSSATAAVANVNDAPTGSVTISGTPTQGQLLTASNTLADADGLGTITYQWKANGSNVATGTTYTLTQAEVGKTITVTASYTDGGGTAEAVTSSATAAVANVNDVPTGSVTITGTPTQGQLLTAANTLADADGLGTITYQWKANGSNIATGTTYTLTQAEVGKTITVTASYTDGGGTAESVTSSATAAVANVNDAPTGAVVITGTASRDQLLTASTATIADLDGLGAFSYQWQRSGDPIVGATGATYTLVQADVGTNISVRVNYTDLLGTAEFLTSAATGTVTAVNSPPSGSVTITGTPAQNQTLTVSNNLADADGLGAISYHWRADSTDIAGATGTSLVLTQAQVGKTITVRATYTDGGGTAESITSSATAAVANVNDVPTGSVTITGTPTQGQLLTAANTLADADGLGTITYQWKANGSNIATGTTYTLTQAEVGKTITVTASYTDGGGTAESVTSSATAAVANVNDAPTGSVTISGTPTQGQLLTASNTLADADGLGTITYQWKANGSNVATGTTYTLTQAEVGKTITVTASYTDGGGTAEAVTSSATAAVANVNDVPTGSVTITGTPTQGQLLTAANTLADADGLGTITYQWKANGSNIATGTTYTLTQAEVGKTITVTASYTDGGGTAESVTSSATAAVANVNDAPTGSVTISGTPTQGQLLTASNTLADADGLGTITYQWKANGSNVATGTTYTLTQAEVGKTITVTASYTDGFGAHESPTSATTAAIGNINDLPTGGVVITGTPSRGQTLTADTTSLADADGLGTLAYQWYRGPTLVAGANAKTYVVADGDIGSPLSVRVSYTDGFGTPEGVASPATGAVTASNSAPTGAVVVAGTALQGQTLTADTASIADADGLGSFSYLWLQGGAPVAGANLPSYQLGQADVGAAMSVQVSYVDGHGTSEQLTSSPTVAVVNVNDAPTVTHAIAPASASVGSALALSLPADTFSDIDGDPLTLTATRADGTALPAWLHFDPAAGSFSGTPAIPDAGVLQLAVTARDASLSATAGFTMTVADPTARSIQGRAMDGYLAGATIYVDANGNNRADVGESTGLVTDSLGNFAGVVHTPGSLIAVGGTDVDTNLSNTLVLLAPEGASVISPLTTLVEAVIDATGLGVSAAQTAVLHSLGLPSGVDLGHFDPLAQPAGDATALIVQKAAVQLAILATLSGTEDAAVSALASRVAAGLSVNFASAETIAAALASTSVSAAVQSAILSANTDVGASGSLAAVAAVQRAAVQPPDTTPPTVVMTDNVAGTANLATPSVLYTLSFSEAVTGLDASDFTVTNGTLGTVGGSGTTWTVAVTPRSGIASGSIGLTLRAGAVTDLAGNPNAVASNAAQAIDTVAPVAPKLITNPAFHSLVDPQVTFHTTLGDVVMEFNPTQAPVTVADVLAYVATGYYNGTLFHRVVPGFVAQGGGLTTGLAVKATTYDPIVLESNNGLSNLRGTVAMARTSAPDTATSQFFVNLVDNTSLNYASAASPGYAVFGKVVAGMSVVDNMTLIPTTTVGPYANVPQTDIVITSAQETRAGSSVASTAVLQVGGLESGSSWQYSLNSGASWLTGTGTTITVPAGSYAANAILVRQTDAAGNLSAAPGHFDTALVVDQAVPTVAGFNPVDDIRGMAVGSNLSVTFSEAIARGTGTITLRTIDGGTAVESFNAASSTALTYSGSTLTINPTADLAYGKGYYLDISAGSVKDIAGNSYAGSTNYNFTTNLVNPADPKSAYYEIVQKIYVAYFGRPADTGGLAFASQYLYDSHAPTDTLGFVLAYGVNPVVTGILDNFGTSAESQALYAGATSRDMVTAVYHYLLNRSPDADGLNFWANAIDAKVLTLAKVALNIMAAAETYPDADGLTVAKKIVVAQNFTTALNDHAAGAAYAGNAAALAARNILSGVDRPTDTGDYEASVLASVNSLLHPTGDVGVGLVGVAPESPLAAN